MAGKGDACRISNYNSYRLNYDQIFRVKVNPKTINKINLDDPDLLKKTAKRVDEFCKKNRASS